ncbi:MAG: hypothetical protein RLZZ584_2831 [Pseudomonadota bacterium]
MMNLDWRHDRQDDINSAAGHAPMDWFGLRPGCFDMAAACAALAHLCPPGHPPVTARLLNVWYTPPQRLMLVYALQSVQGAPVTVTVCIDDRAPAPCGASGAMTGTAVPEWQALAWRLPQDPGQLPLSLLLEPRYTASSLGVARVPTRPDVISAPRPTMLSYLPGKRLALRVAAPDGGGQLVLKHQRGAARSHAAMTSLWSHAGRRFDMAEPMGVDPANDVRWERFLPGQRIEATAARQGWEATLRRFLPSLVDLHGTPVASLPVQHRAVVLDRLQGKVARRVAAALSGHHATLLALCERLSAWMPEPAVVHTTLHGDLHTGNLLVTASHGYAFIDLDSLAVGEPAYDLALLGSRLLLLAVLGQADPVQVQVLAAELGTWYEQAGGTAGSAQAYAWHLATLLPARQLKTCIRHAAPGLPALADTLLRLANRIVGLREVPADLLVR